MASKILREGVTHKECSGDLERWVTAKYLKYKKANNIRLYGKQCYIFKNDTLITVLRIPENLVGEVARIRKERITAKKYYLDRNDVILIHGLQLFRIIAERDFSDVHKGDLGGYIMNTRNLSHEGDCWVYDDAHVYGRALIKDNATVRNEASIDGHAVISGYAAILDHSVVRDNATVSEHVILTGNSQIRGNACICGKGTASNYVCNSDTHRLPIAAQNVDDQIPTDAQEDELHYLMEVSFCRNEQEAQLLHDWLCSH